MTDDIIRMAREAHGRTTGEWWDMDVAALERFAELAIKPWADQLEVERKRFQELNDVVAIGMQHARAAERRACAKIFEDHWRETWTDEQIVEAIRARGAT